MRAQRVEQRVGGITWPAERIECVGLHPSDRGAPEFETVFVGGRKRESLHRLEARFVVALPKMQLGQEHVRADGVRELGSELIEHRLGVIELAALKMHVEDVPQCGTPDRGERGRRRGLAEGSYRRFRIVGLREGASEVKERE